ncbi:MAG TPA: UvrD-helicase domain-containing protein [Dongiaceae bacterium]|jgi:DNA helicase-2/ATP-dependent DNA helicase PcrA|nr:UvrD-helicase domain-containing protein [Dongiaceae bacterium]
MQESDSDPIYLRGLNERQREAVLASDGAVLVLAGAGTGKTKVLTARIAHLLATHRANPAQILAVTFTNKAAGEMRERIGHLLGRPVEGWWLGTFHSLAARLLRPHAERVGLRPNFTILDQDDQKRLLKQLLTAANIDEKKWPARLVLSIIGRWKDRGLTPEKVSVAEGGDALGGRILSLYQEYQERLRTLNACDFGDLLLYNLELFSRAGDVLAQVQQRFRYILVDEYQDTNVAQYLWLRFLALGGSGNICCVGDEDQSIYSFRGAEIGNILRFEKDFPGAVLIRLEQNYRSTPHILAAASHLIARNQRRLGKTLWTAENEGEPVRLLMAWDGEEEAREIGDDIEQQQRSGVGLGRIAILVRAGFQTREFEERFVTMGLPYRVIGGPRFYERQEIRDALAYLRLIHQPDDSLAFERIVNVPKRGLGDATLQALHAGARHAGISLPEAARRLVLTDELRPAARRALADFLHQLERWRALEAERSHGELAEIVLDESGYTGMWQADKSAEAAGRLDNLKEFVRAMEEFEHLGAFLEHVQLVMEIADGDPTEKVSLMTLHGAKGLEFEVVYLPGWEEGMFPHPRALDEAGEAGLEEERRLAYVGLTRARRLAIVSYALNRRLHNQWQSTMPSRFVDELPPEHVEKMETQVYQALHRAPQVRGFAETRRTPAFQVQPLPTASRSYHRGERIFHRKFGYGQVLSVDGDRLEITFDKAGHKMVLAGFVQPAAEAR